MKEQEQGVPEPGRPAVVYALAVSYSFSLVILIP